MRYLFFNVPAYGHINPTLAVVKELVNRGHHVTYYAFDQFRSKIESTGAEYRSYNQGSQAMNALKAGNFLALMRMIIDVTSDGLQELLDEVRAIDPDCIIHDSLCLWGKLVAQRLNLPAVSSISTFVFNREVMNPEQRIPPLYRKLPMLYKTKTLRRDLETLTGRHAHLEDLPELLMNTEELNIVYTSKMLQPRGEYFPENYHFIGASLSERQGEKRSIDIIPNKKPVIYISLGTIVNRNIIFYQQCFSAFRDMDCTVILSVGENTNVDLLGPIPSNFIIRSFVPQLKVLAICDVFITHGGMNSVHEGLYYKVPLIVVPQQREQKMVAKRVVECGSGICLEKVNVEQLRKSVETILENPEYKSAANRLSDSLIAGGGSGRAADVIEKYCENK